MPKEGVEIVIRLIMKRLHTMEKMTLMPNEVEVVYATRVDPRVASDVNRIVDALVYKLTVRLICASGSPPFIKLTLVKPVPSAQVVLVLRAVLQALRRSSHLDTNVPAAHPASRPEPVTQPTGPTVIHTSEPSPFVRPPVPEVSSPSTAIASSSFPQPISRSGPAELPTQMPLSTGPPALASSPSFPGGHANQIHTQVGEPYSTFAPNGRLGNSDSGYPSAHRTPHTVLNAPPTSQAGPPSTPPTARHNTPLTPNTKTLARDILRSLGRPTKAHTSAASSVSSPSPSNVAAVAPSMLTCEGLESASHHSISAKD